MSAIATFYLIDTDKLGDLCKNAEVIVKKGFFSKKIIDNYWEFLSNNATELNRLDGSGYVYANLLVFLEEEKQIGLLSNEYDPVVEELITKRGNSHSIFTYAQKISFLSKLQPTLFSPSEIQKFNQEFSEEADEETTIQTIEALRLLYENLGKIQSNNRVLLLIVG